MPGKSYLMLIPAVLLLFIFAFYKFPSIGPSASNVHTMCFGDFISFFKRLDLRFLYITLVSTQTLLWAIVFILPDVLITLDHVEWICYGGGHSCLILGGAAMMVPAGYLADKYSARNVILAATLIGAFIFYILLFFGNISSTFVLINLFVLGACLAVIQPVGIALGCKLEPNKPSMISAFLMGMVWVVSEALGPGGVGLMSKLFDDYAPVKALSVLGFFFLVGIYASWRLPKHVGSSDVAIEQVSV
jgi:FSR family fosmidomycin resistance protein-like MFS transporter